MELGPEQLVSDGDLLQRMGGPQRSNGFEAQKPIFFSCFIYLGAVDLLGQVIIVEDCPVR